MALHLIHGFKLRRQVDPAQKTPFRDWGQFTNPRTINSNARSKSPLPQPGSWKIHTGHGNLDDKTDVIPENIKIWSSSLILSKTFYNPWNLLNISVFCMAMKWLLSRPLESLRMGTGHQKNQAINEDFGHFSLPPTPTTSAFTPFNLWKGGENWVQSPMAINLVNFIHILKPWPKYPYMMGFGELLNTLMCWKEHGELRYIALCISSIWLFLSCILYNKPENIRKLSSCVLWVVLANYQTPCL